MTKYALACALLMAYSASAQVQFGSVVVIDFAKDHLVVAADSRSRYGINGPINDSTCKIAAFNHQVIFTNVGYSAYTKISLLDPVESWDNIEEAYSIIRSLPQSAVGDAQVENIATAWAQDITAKWRVAYQAHREDITLWAEQNKGQLTAGAFAEVKNGRVYFRVAVIVLDVAAIEPIRFVLIKNPDDCQACGQDQGKHVCMGGEKEIGQKFCSTRKSNSTISVRTTLKESSRDVILATKLVEITIDAYRKTNGNVGGHVNAVTLQSNGRIAWNSNPDCRKNRD
jgi:hypothetical protein